MYIKAPWPQYHAHLICYPRYLGMYPICHFTMQYMHVLHHGRCMSKYIKQLTNLSTFSFTFTIGFSLGILQSPPLIYALSSVHNIPIYNKTLKILKKMQVFYLHCILMLPSSILRTVPGPLDLYNLYGLILELFDFPVHNAYQMYLVLALKIYW